LRAELAKGGRPGVAVEATSQVAAISHSTGTVVALEMGFDTYGRPTTRFGRFDRYDGGPSPTSEGATVPAAADLSEDQGPFFTRLGTPVEEESPLDWPVGPSYLPSETDRQNVHMTLDYRLDALLAELRDSGVPAELLDSPPIELVALLYYLSDLERFDAQAAAGDSEARSIIRCAYAVVGQYARLGQLPLVDSALYASVPAAATDEDLALLALEQLAVRNLLPVGSRPVGKPGEVVIEFPEGAGWDVSVFVGEPAGSVLVAHAAGGYEPFLVPQGVGPGVPLVSLQPAAADRPPHRPVLPQW
jgi:hypothetical protein